MLNFVVVSLLLLAPAAQGAPATRSDDEYTRYELLAPETSSFKIVYDVTAVSPGAKFFFNPIRRGSEASDESVIDLATGRPLEFKDVSGSEARQSGLNGADLEGRYIRVALAHPVPEGGEARIRIIKTYKDPKSYFVDGDTIVFDRPLGIKRNAVVLPAGYELVSCNVPSQVIEEPDGRIAISLINIYPGQAPLKVRAKRLARGTGTKPTTPARSSPSTTRSSSSASAAVVAAEEPMEQIRVSERASQTREIVYFLQQPETHAFSLYHDFTETREGTDRYLNIVRRGSAVSNPSARSLDSGEALKTETLRGAAITKAGIDIGEPVQPDSEVVVVRFPAVPKGASHRIRIEETYTDPARYTVVNGELLWHRSFGRPENEIVLPDGWYLTTSSVPAVVSQTDDGKVRLAFVNPRSDEIDVFVKARRR